MRQVITAKDIQIYFGKKESMSFKMMSQIKKELGKKKHQPMPPVLRIPIPWDQCSILPCFRSFQQLRNQKKLCGIQSCPLKSDTVPGKKSQPSSFIIRFVPAGTVVSLSATADSTAKLMKKRFLSVSKLLFRMKLNNHYFLVSCRFL